MKLEKIKIEKFKKIKSVELRLSPLNVLVGANGSGKSSIIQAIHLASCLIRQADRLRENSTSTVGIGELDYLPSNNYPELGNGSKWGNKKGTPSSKVSFTFQKDKQEYEAWTEFRSARNAGVSVTGNIQDRSLLNALRGRTRFFTAYIPGVSGIPNSEQKQSKRVVLRACSYGDSNVYLRNVLVLLKEDAQNIKKIEDWLSLLIGDVKIDVTHDDESDLEIVCRININKKDHPIELIGAGYIQLIQIFSYILLFKPKILLIDEPDIHLHPNVQEKLPKLLSLVAEEMGLKIIMTTHSPFIVRGSPISSNIYWINEGKVEKSSRETVELALGWGAFGKKIILVSEDSNIKFLQKIMAQWPEIDKFVTFYPGTGYSNIPTPSQAEEIHNALGGKYNILIHRDRDSLTDYEIEQISQKYTEKGLTIWFPDESDIEAYFCLPEFLCEFLTCTNEDAVKYIDTALTKNQLNIQGQFEKQRTAHNAELYKQGGSPLNDIVWEEFQNRNLKGAKGKFIFNQLKGLIPQQAFKEERILDFKHECEISPNLKAVLENLLDS